jgi:hypothetical protein
MSSQTSEIETLLADVPVALERWYTSLTPDDDSDIVLAGGLHPALNRIGALFDQWCSERAEQLKRILCDGLHYRDLTKRKKELGEVAVIAAVCTALSQAPIDVDPVATAVLLIGRRTLDALCGCDPGET